MIVAVNGMRDNSGKKTLAVALANSLSKNGKKTLLIDLDYKNTSFAQTYGFTNSERNTESYLEQAFKNGNFNLVNHIIPVAASEPKQQELKKQLASYSDNLYALSFSENFQLESMDISFVQNWSVDQSYAFMEQFATDLKSLEFDFIIISMPVGLDDMFTLPCILFSDFCVNIFKFSVTQIEDIKKMLGAFDQQNANKFIHILNETSRKVEKADFEQICKPIKLHSLIPFDEARAVNEINGVPSSPNFEVVVQHLVKTFGVEVETKRRKFLLKG